jgi:hypothetical protein
MFTLTFRDQPVCLLDLAPEWGAGFEATARLLSQVEAGLSQREARRPHSAALRWQVNFTIRAPAAESRRLAAGLKVYQTQPVLLPFWPFAVPWAERAAAPLAGGLQAATTPDLAKWEVWFFDGSTRHWTRRDPDGETSAGADNLTAPSWPGAADTYLPVLMGRLEKTEPLWETGDRCRFDVDFAEAGPAYYATRPPAGTFPAGPLPGAGWSSAPRLFPIRLEFVEHREHFTTSIVRDAIGFGREAAETLYPQTTARELQTAHALLDQAELAGLLAFFLDHGGGAPFWTASARAALQLAAPLGSGQTDLLAADVADLAVGDWLAFCRAGIIAATARVTNLSGLTVSLDAAPGAFSTAELVARLHFVRWLRPTLALKWHTAGFAEATLALREVPAEIAPAADETLGQTLGLLPARAYLYAFSRMLDGVPTVERVTSYETDLTYEGHTYAAAKIEHGEIRQGLALDRDEVQLSADFSAVVSLLQLATLKLSAPLSVTIIAAEATGGAATNGGVLFSGEITKVNVKGSRLAAAASPGGSAFDRKLPRALIGPQCNWALFSTPCGLAAADWKFTAAVNDPGAPGFPFTFELKNLARVAGDPPVFFDNWFAGGWIELGAGAAWQRLPILQSTSPVAGVLTVTLSRDPEPFPQPNDAVVLYPGCDGRAVTCRAYNAERNPEGKFDNYLNFGGHPFVPAGNPSIVRKAKAGAASKK